MDKFDIKYVDYVRLTQEYFLFLLNAPQHPVCIEYIENVARCDAVVESLSNYPFVAVDTEFCSNPNPYHRWDQYKKHLYNVTPTNIMAKGPFAVLLQLSDPEGRCYVIDLRHTGTTSNRDKM